MKKLGVKTSRYANTDFYTPEPINAEGEGAITLDGLKYGFESGFQFFMLNVPKKWINPTGEYEKFIRDFCTEENRLRDWDKIEEYFAECVPDPGLTEEEDQALADELYARFGM